MTPGEFIDHVVTLKSLKNDSALCRALEISPAELSRVRNGGKPMGAVNILRFHALTGMAISEMCSMLRGHLASPLDKWSVPNE